MKIAIITSQVRQNTGYGRVSFELIKFLQRGNFEVVVICSRANDELRGVRQIPILPAPLSFRRNYFLCWVYLFKLFKHKKELKNCDAIHCLVEVYSLLTLLLSKLLQKKYFLLMHGTYSVAPFKNKFYGLLQKLAYKDASKIICVSNYTKNKILKHVNLANLTVIPNGVDVENFRRNKRDERSYLGKKNILMSLGAFKERKGFALIIKALAIIAEEIPDIKCYIGGGAGGSKDYYRKLMDLVDELNLSDRIVFFKDASDDYIKDLYGKTRVFALTTISGEYNFEGFGLVYLEANAYGVPVIGCYGSGAVDAIKDGYSGFLAKPGDINDIAEKTIRLFKDENLYATMSKNALLWARKHSWKNIFKEYIKIYKEQLL
jgi:phosphatidylinositol alpha-1,6-mannosyltransferase